jgi:hypothetical protein
VRPGESDQVRLLRNLRNRSQPIGLRAPWLRVVTLLVQKDPTAGPRLAPPRGAPSSLQCIGRLTANLGGRTMGRFCGYRNADDIQQLQRRLEAHVRSLAALEFSHEPYAHPPTSSEVGTAKAEVPAGIFEQHAYSSREHLRASRLVD